MHKVNVELVPELRRSGVKTRASTLLSAKAIGNAGVEIGIRIRNLSETGLGGVCVTGFGFRNGEKVTVMLRDESWIAGRVMWVDGRRFGAVFDQRIDVVRFNEAARSTRPDFEVTALHAVEKRAWRPALAAR